MAICCSNPLRKIVSPFELEQVRPNFLKRMLRQFDWVEGLSWIPVTIFLARRTTSDDVPNLFTVSWPVDGRFGSLHTLYLSKVPVMDTAEHFRSERKRDNDGFASQY